MQAQNPADLSNSNTQEQHEAEQRGLQIVLTSLLDNNDACFPSDKKMELLMVLLPLLVSME
jgi:hypothetical protein